MNLSNIFVIGLSCLMLFSCNNTSSIHTYKYVELQDVRGIFSKSIREKDTVKFTAANDSLAYIEGYTKFCISKKVSQDMTEVSLDTDIPISFKLFDDKGLELTDKSLPNAEQRKQEIEKDIFSQPNTFKEAKGEKNLSVANFDSAKIKDLKKYFTVKKDEFDASGAEWYKPKSAPKYVNTNGIYCYFQVRDGQAYNFRFTIQYYADDWIFFKKCLFSIDGKAFEFIPSDINTDNGDGYIWEWFDESISGSDVQTIEALSNAKTAKIKFVGREYYDIKTLSKDQILNIKRSLELYKAMGGMFNQY